MAIVLRAMSGVISGRVFSVVATIVAGRGGADANMDLATESKVTLGMETAETGDSCGNRYEISGRYMW